MQHDLGSFQVKSGTLVVVDPSYRQVQEPIENALNGWWLASVELQKVGCDRMRIMALHLSHYDHRNSFTAYKRMITVDGGVMSAADLSVWQGPRSPTNETNLIDLVMSMDKRHIDAHVHHDMAICASGDGDGSYPLSIATVGGKVVAVSIEFDQDPTENEDDYY